MVRKVTEWPSHRGPITKIMPSDGCKGDEVPLALGQWYNFHEVGCHLGNVGQFNSLFNAIYGERWFSGKRAFRSVISTIIAFISIALISRSTILDFTEADDFVFVVGVMFFLNFVVDYASLQETKWVLSKIKDRNYFVLLLFVPVDLLLTLFIFLVGWYSMFLVHPDFQWIYSPILDGSVDFRVFSAIFESFLEWGFDVDIAGVYFYTTFFTSALWFLFVLFVSIIKFTDAITSIVRRLLFELAKTEKPAQLVAAGLSTIFVVISVMLWGVEGFISGAI